MSDYYGEQLDEAFASFPETDTRFVVNGMEGGPNSGIAGMILKPWDERERTQKQLNPLVQASSTRSPASRCSPSRCRRCPARPAACRCRW